MRKKKILLPALVFVFVCSSALSLLAQDGDQTFYGNFKMGYRYVDSSGANTKYKEDLNLDTGVRLFDFSLHYTPTEQFRNLFDRIDVNIYNFGGDPFEAMRMSIQKFGKYKFQYDRRKSTYFYDDRQEVSGGALFDHHTFNFDRIADSALFEISFGKKVDFYVNYDRFTKKGNSVTTLDINRIEFELDKPIEEESDMLALGLNFNLKRYSFVLEERIHEYENTNSLFLPGYADGGAGARYPSFLNLYFLSQPYDFQTNTHTFKFNGRPLDSLLIKFSAQYSDMDMNLTHSEEADGIDYVGAPYVVDLSGTGSFSRKIGLYDLDLTYLLSNKVAVVASARYHDFEQDGTMTVDGSDESAALSYDTQGIEAGLQYQFNPKLALTLGYQFEIRDLQGTETVTNETESLRSGFFGNLKWNIRQGFRLTFDYQRGYFDGPYTLISPTLFDRFRTTIKYSVQQFDFSGSYLLTMSECEIPSELWESDTNQLMFRAGYNTDKFKLFAGYSLIDVDSKTDRDIYYPPDWSGPEGTFPWSVHYEGKSNLIDAMLKLKLGTNWKLGAYANIYSNKGSWEISRTTAKAYLEYAFDNGFNAQIGYRFVDFKEKASGLNDYKANIFEISFGYSWE